jgi:hypothetical protein
MPKCLECGVEAPRLQWTHFKYNCTGKFSNGREYRKVYPHAILVDPDLCKRTAVTLDNFILKYGVNQGTTAWETYRKKQAISNTLEYKQTTHGWTKEEFDDFNKSRSVTLANLIKRHGEVLGTEKWIAYCERQAYTNTEQYFIEKYGDIEGRTKYQQICFLKSHSVESIMQRNNCSEEDAIQHYSNFNHRPTQFSSQLELLIVDAIEQKLGTTLRHTAKTKQYCINVNKKIYMYDIVHNNRAIEINGDYWHCNPALYTKNYFNQITGITAYETWQNDHIKLQHLLDYRQIPTLVLWESDYYANPTQKIEECITWLTQKDNK